MHVGVLGFWVGFQVGGFGGPVGVLPHDESFVQGVEAVTAEGGGVDGEGFLVPFAVGEVQGQGVGDPTLFFQRLDRLLDEVQGYCFILVGQDEIHISTASS